MVKGYITTTEAAALIGVSPQWVRQLAADGLLKGQRFGRDWLIDARDAKRVAAQPYTVGKPRGAKNLVAD